MTTFTLPYKLEAVLMLYTLRFNGQALIKFGKLLKFFTF